MVAEPPQCTGSVACGAHGGAHPFSWGRHYNKHLVKYLQQWRYMECLVTLIISHFLPQMKWSASCAYGGSLKNVGALG